ncbi:MAG: phosphoribosylformylglycinamidine synthase subunit PurS [Actinomycetes bacterium]|jgi:phosphoribosylformylglycinamidine synthase|nr:phosphoribosylformylglycinamidine synthase subunit PurS [Actinomycetes bacterium]
MAKYEILVTYRTGIFDPAGETARRGLEQIGFTGVDKVSIGKFIQLDADATPDEVQVMCEKLLANPVIEDFAIKSVG